jgi:4-amino-4-deoxy-L-arabinose transferase-like glycosyltransferase
MGSWSSSARIALVCVALAAGLRVYNLDWNSLDGDEGASLALAHRPVPELVTHFVDLRLDPHPLLYYLILKGWIGLAGDSDIAVRLLSALAGTATVALAYRLGRRWSGNAAGLVAAFILTVNPLVVAEDQDARMYALGLCFSAAGFWALSVGLHRPAHKALPSLGLVVVALTLASYSHITGGLLLPSAGLVVLLNFRGGGRTAGYALMAVVLAGALYLPYLARVYAEGSPPAALDAGAWLEYLLQVSYRLWFRQLPVLSSDWRWPILAVTLLVAVVGTWRNRANRMILPAWLFPIVLLATFVAIRRGYLQPKTLVFAALPLALITGSAIAGTARRLHWTMAACLLPIVGAQLSGLGYLWRPGFQKEDFRTAAQFVSTYATAQDVVMVHLSWYHLVFQHYYARPFVYPLGSAAQPPGELAERLPPLTQAEVIWLVQAGVGLAGEVGDPDRVVERWFAERFPVVTAVYPMGVEVKGYAGNYRTTHLPTSAAPLEVAFPNGLILRGYRLPETSLPVRDIWLHPPSTWVHATLYWSVTTPLLEAVRMEVTLEDEVGAVWGSDLPRADDLRAFYPPLQWRPGEVIRQDFTVNTNPEIAPGEYKVVLRVYDAAGIPLLLDAAAGQDWLILDEVILHP